MHKFATGFLIVCVIAVIGAVGGAAYWATNSSFRDDEPSIESDVPTTGTDVTKANKRALAFFYQSVGAFTDGKGHNAVRAGYSETGRVVHSYDADVLNWTIAAGGNEGYGDPVFSYLQNGNWAMTAWSTPSDPRGAAGLMYYEGECPIVDDAKVNVLGPSTATGCAKVSAIATGKTSQVFSDGSDDYLLHAIGGSIYLAHLADESHAAANLESICVLPDSPSSLSILEYGASMRIIDGTEEGLLLSDTAIARRFDGTWVAYVKGIPPDSGCTRLTLCELCTRAIYRTTSENLVDWSPLTKVIGAASVPEASAMPGGGVRLYWQDFNDACEAEDQALAAIAPISSAEDPPGYSKTQEPATISIPDEAFETDKNIHYATNANPILLPSEEALAALAACLP